MLPGDLIQRNTLFFSIPFLSLSIPFVSLRSLSLSLTLSLSLSLHPLSLSPLLSPSPSLPLYPSPALQW